jgi:CheY-like chemotaxis protein
MENEIVSALSLPILIADDDADDRLLMKMAFSELNIPNPVIFFKDGDEVMGYLTSTCQENNGENALPGLLLLDVNMPRKNGIQVLREVKTHPYWKQICVCMLSTARTNPQVIEAQESGADNYIAKPDTYDDLLTVVQSVYDQWLQSVIDNQSAHPCTMPRTEI